MPVEVSIHPLDEALVQRYFIRGLVDGVGVVDIDEASKTVRRKQTIDLIADHFKEEVEPILVSKENVKTEVILFGRPYFLTGVKAEEVVNVVQLLEQAQTAEEIFDILHRQAEHVDFSFAEHKASAKPQVMQQVHGMPTMGALQMQMYDWLERKAYLYAMTRFAGFMAKRKIKKFKPKRLSPEEATHFKQQMKRKPEEISAEIGARIGHDVATLMETMFPTWRSKEAGLTDIGAWAEHLFPMIEGPHSLFRNLPTYKLLEPHIPRRVKTNTSGGYVSSQNMGQFIDALVSCKKEIIQIFERVGHYKEMAMSMVNRLKEVGTYCLERGYGLIEANGVQKPY